MPLHCGLLSPAILITLLSIFCLTFCERLGQLTEKLTIIFCTKKISDSAPDVELFRNVTTAGFFWVTRHILVSANPPEKHSLLFNKHASRHGYYRTWLLQASMLKIRVAAQQGRLTDGQVMRGGVDWSDVRWQLQTPSIGPTLLLD